MTCHTWGWQRPVIFLVYKFVFVCVFFFCVIALGDHDISVNVARLILLAPGRAPQTSRAVQHVQKVFWHLRFLNDEERNIQRGFFDSHRWTGPRVLYPGRTVNCDFFRMLARSRSNIIFRITQKILSVILLYVLGEVLIYSKHSCFYRPRQIDLFFALNIFFPQTLWMDLRYGCEGTILSGFCNFHLPPEAPTPKKTEHLLYKGDVIICNYIKL